MQALRSLSFALVAVALSGAGCSNRYEPYQARDAGRSIALGGKHVVVEVADRMETRQHGLMERQSLPPDHGMLFVYPSPKILGFWMRNTPIPLSIAFIEELDGGKGRIVNVEEMAPYVEYPSYASHRPVRLALEMTKGWFSDHGVKAGDTFDLPAWIGELVPGEDR